MNYKSDDEIIFSTIRKRTRRRYLKMESLLKEWYGDDTGNSEEVAYLPKTVHVKEGVEKVMEKAFGKEHMLLTKLNERWPELTGPQVSRVSRPASFFNGVLTIEVDNSAWLMELKNYSALLIEKKITEMFGQKPYKKLVFAASGRTKRKSTGGTGTKFSH